MSGATISKEVIPAGPGWSVCEPIYDDSDCISGLDESPVIAWVVIYDAADSDDIVSAYAQPVIADCVITCGWDSPVLKRPDGRYVICEDRFFHTADEVMAYLRQREKKTA